MAGGTNVGNLNATLSLNQFEFNSGLKQSETAAMEFANTVEVQSKRADAAMKRAGSSSSRNMAGGMAQGVTQVGFMIQDFNSQFATRGLGPAIGAITNNVQMLGAAFGPVGMAVSAVGGALAGILLPRLIETGSLFKQTAQEAETSLNSLRTKVEKSWQPFHEMSRARIDILAGTEEQLDKRLQTMREKFWELEAERKHILNDSQIARNMGDNAQADQFIALANEKTTAMNAITTQGRALAGLRPEIKAKEAEKKAQDEHFKMLKDRDEFESSLRTKQLAEYGSASEKIEAQRTKDLEKASRLRAGKEAIDRINAMAQVDLQRASITESEKALSEMGAASGSSAGVARGSTAGVQAMNRAAAGSKSEQSDAKQQIAIQKDQLKKLEQIAKSVGNPVKMVALSG